MLYYILRPYVRFILNFFIKRIDTTGLANVPSKGAVLLASTHPNSFLDAIIICCMLNRRVWSLARGDAFKKAWVKKILMSLFMMPIYRISEGKENLGNNDETFQKCHELFEKGEIVLIFSEGLCMHQTSLLPLKKGTARLIQTEWSTDKNVVVLPVGIMYDSFDEFGKKITLNIGKILQKADFQPFTTDGFFVKTFNERLSSQLNSLLSHHFGRANFFNNPFYYIGWVFNFPIYFLAQFLSKRITKGSVFYDSVTLALLVFLLPFYWFLGYTLINSIL